MRCSSWRSSSAMPSLLGDHRRDLPVGEQHRGVVAVAEHPADLRIGALGQLAAEIHGVLPRLGELALAAGWIRDPLGDAVGLRRHVLDRVDLGRANRRAAELKLDRLLDRRLGERLAGQHRADIDIAHGAVERPAGRRQTIRQKIDPFVVEREFRVGRRNGIGLGAHDLAAQAALRQVHVHGDAALDFVAHAIVELVEHGRRLVARQHHHAAIRDDRAQVREELDQRAGLGADELEIVEQHDLRAAHHRAQVGGVLPFHAFDEGDREVLRAHVEHAAIAARGFQRRLDSAEKVRLADAVRTDHGHDVGRHARAERQPAGEAEGDAVGLADQEILERLLLVRTARIGSAASGADRLCRRDAAACACAGWARASTSGSIRLADIEAHLAAARIGLGPRVLDVADEFAVDAVVFKFARRSDQDLAVHFGDEFEVRNPGIETCIADAAAQRLTRTRPDGRESRSPSRRRRHRPCATQSALNSVALDDPPTPAGAYRVVFCLLIILPLVYPSSSASHLPKSDAKAPRRLKPREPQTISSELGRLLATEESFSPNSGDGQQAANAAESKKLIQPA